jgi:hypothetical protein
LKLKHLAEPPVPKIFAEEVREVEDAQARADAAIKEALGIE